MRLTYGTTPPRLGTSDADVRVAASRLTNRLGALPLDAIVVYDIQDETGRTEVPRPFPFVTTVDPRDYARILGQSSSVRVVTYKSVGELDEDGWSAWLSETAQEYGTRYLSVVGRPTSGVAYPLTLTRAIRVAAEHPAGFIVGGVAIAERHTEGRSEAARLLTKGTAGCRFFISQAVYHAGPTVRLLRDYLRDCREVGVEPWPISLTFAPCGRAKTMAFLRWLGVAIAAETEEAILGGPSPLSRSIAICRENLLRILDQPYRDRVPIGVNVESVSIFRDEIDASIELFHVLRETLETG